jgi:hypothetical protein
MMKTVLLMLVASFQGGGEPDCSSELTKPHSPPPFSCPSGQPNTACMQSASTIFEIKMQLAGYERCRDMEVIDEELAEDYWECLEQYSDCCENETPLIDCQMQQEECYEYALSSYNAMKRLIDNRYAQAQADAQDEFYNSAMECCP